MNKLSVVSYNILVPHWAHVNKPCLKGEPWIKRCKRLVDKSVSSKPDVIALQEVENFKDLHKLMKTKGYDGIFSSRNNKTEEGCAIFYQSHRFDEITSKPLFFNDGTGRLVMMIKLRSKDRNNVFNVFSTHIDWAGKKQGEISQLAKFATSEGNSSIVCGDFNVKPTNSYLSPLKQNKFQDAHRLCSKSSFNPGKRIDYIFVDQSIKLVSADVYGNYDQLKGVQEPSDHLPIEAVLTLPKGRQALHDDILDIVKKLGEGRFAEGLALFDGIIPKYVRHRVYSLIDHLERKAGVSNYHRGFGRAAFRKEGNCHISDALRKKALELVLLELCKDDLDVFNKLSNSIKKEVFYHLYLVEKGKNNPGISNGSFGRAAFYNKHGCTSSQTSRHKAIANYLQKLQNQ